MQNPPTYDQLYSSSHPIFLRLMKVWGFLGDRIGRRTTLLMVASSTMIFGLASSAAKSYPWLLFLRGLVGWSLGGFGVGFTYLMEVLPRAERGT
jgi:MFS family permease